MLIIQKKEDKYPSVGKGQKAIYKISVVELHIMHSTNRGRREEKEKKEQLLNFSQAGNIFGGVEGKQTFL